MFSFFFRPQQSRRTLFADVVRQALVVVTALAQFFIPVLPSVGVGRSVGVQVGGNHGLRPEVPAGYAFGIWFVIFVLALVYAVYQALPSQRENQGLRATGWWMAGAFCLSSLWMFVVQMLGDVWPLAVVIAGMLFCSLAAFFSALRVVSPGAFHCGITIPLLGMLSGWLSLATFLNISSVLKKILVVPGGPLTLAFASIVLGVAAMVAIFILRASNGNVWYAGAVAWGLLGVVVADVVRPETLPVALIAAGLLTLVLVVTWRVRR